jgi:hypothetical protein
VVSYLKWTEIYNGAPFCVQYKIFLPFSVQFVQSQHNDLIVKFPPTKVFFTSVLKYVIFQWNKWRLHVTWTYSPTPTYILYKDYRSLTSIISYHRLKVNKTAWKRQLSTRKSAQLNTGMKQELQFWNLCIYRITGFVDFIHCLVF